MKKIARFLVIFGVAVLFSVPTQPLKATEPYVTYYEVWYCGVVGPPTNELVGYWVRDCEGNLSGWGWAPYSDLTCTIETQGETCYQLP